MAEGALGGSTIAANHAWVPCEKSLLNDTHATLECHRLHPQYWPLLTLMQYARPVLHERARTCELNNFVAAVGHSERLKCNSSTYGDGRSNYD
jgi:hypothetical protein